MNNMAHSGWEIQSCFENTGMAGIWPCYSERYGLNCAYKNYKIIKDRENA